MSACAHYYTIILDSASPILLAPAPTSSTASIPTEDQAALLFVAGLCNTRQSTRHGSHRATPARRPLKTTVLLNVCRSDVVQLITNLHLQA